MVCVNHRAELNRGVPRARSIKIMGEILGEGWIQNLSHFQLDLLFSPHPCTKVIGKTQDGTSYFCNLPSDWLERLYSSIQVKFYCIDALYRVLPWPIEAISIDCMLRYVHVRHLWIFRIQHLISILLHKARKGKSCHFHIEKQPIKDSEKIHKSVPTCCRWSLIGSVYGLINHVIFFFRFRETHPFQFILIAVILSSSDSVINKKWRSRNVNNKIITSSSQQKQSLLL